MSKKIQNDDTDCYLIIIVRQGLKLNRYFKPTVDLTKLYYYNHTVYMYLVQSQVEFQSTYVENTLAMSIEEIMNR